MGNAEIEDSDSFKEDCLNALLSLVDDDLNEILCHLQLALNKRNNHDQSVLNILRTMRLLFYKLPNSCNIEQMVFGVIPKGDSEIRIADWLNLGLDAPCVRTKVEAIKALWKVCLHVSDTKGCGEVEVPARAQIMFIASAIVEVLVDIFMEERTTDVLTITTASLWEIAFIKPHVAPMLIRVDANDVTMHFWHSLHHADCIVRHTAILSAARILLYPTMALLELHTLFGVLLEMYLRPGLHTAYRI
ncbi:unnamed protein product [Albugo candida]|uniref:Uncharacterized protein n=1 Tax=Albugo candida TaxID=65357 RepID=A0A024G3B6_9STRA|nr:unnamed protein product [Albugo candida]|eukprot:CCI41161.1 unnamed protein product [Albugo candida]